MSLLVINNSAWPTPAIHVLAEWCCHRVGVGTPQHPYTVRVEAADPRSRPNGRPSRDPSMCNFFMGRRYSPSMGWPETYSYRCLDGNLVTYSIFDRIEALVHWLAIHVHCATANHMRSNLVVDSPQAREARHQWFYACMRAGYEAVEAFRPAWPELKARVVFDMREQRYFTKLQEAKENTAVRKAQLKCALSTIADAHVTIAALGRQQKLLRARLRALNRAPRPQSAKRQPAAKRQRKCSER